MNFTGLSKNIKSYGNVCLKTYFLQSFNCSFSLSIFWTEKSALNVSYMQLGLNLFNIDNEYQLLVIYCSLELKRSTN